MAKGTREIRRKIKSVKNTRQITKAMELVAASKMRRAVSNTMALRPYARLAQALLVSLAQRLGSTSTQVLHPLLSEREVHRVLVVVVGTDRGLCGGLNTQLFRSLQVFLREEEKKPLKPEFSFVALGRKAQEFLRRSGRKVVAAYPAMSNHPKLGDTYPISRMILQEYEKGTYDKVMLVYTDFVSAITQKPNVRRLLPLSRKALDEMIDEIAGRPMSESAVAKEAESLNEYLFEPSPKEVLEMLLPRLTEMQIYQSILEATASEHAARMFAMRNASDNAADFISDLTLTYNRIRQAGVTAELAEISAGRAALG